MICAIGLVGCHPKERKPNVYSYCVVEGVEKLVEVGSTNWVTRCADGAVVILPRMIAKGQGIYYVPYELDSDSVTMRGYIANVENMIP